MKYFFYILGGVLLFTLDAITKFGAKKFLQEHSIHIIGNLLSLKYAQNTGIAFSVPLTGTLLKIVTVILIFGIIWYYISEEKQKNSKILNISYSLIITGALGNAWERIFRGYVTDFISVEYFSIFNLADSYIFLGACGILYFYFLNKRSCHLDPKK